MDRILTSLKKENDPRASSAPALGLNTIIFKHVYWYMQQTQVSVYRTIGPLVYMQVTNSKSFFFLFLKTTITLLCLSQACAGRKACESGVKMNVNTLKI